MTKTHTHAHTHTHKHTTVCNKFKMPNEYLHILFIGIQTKKFTSLHGFKQSLTCNEGKALKTISYFGRYS
jgi:hypothetical protein